MYQALFFGYIFWVCLTLGCVAVLLMHHTMRGSWGLPILRVVEAGAKTLPITFIIFLVIALTGLKELYPWARPEVIASDPVLMRKAAWWLNSSGFLIRGVIYYAIWAAFTYFLIGSSKRQEVSGDLMEQQKRSNIAPPGIVLFVLSGTLAFTDWVMSLDPHWFSTIFGAWFVIGQLLACLSFSTIFILRRVNQSPYKEVINPQLTRDLGNLMLTFTMVWAYFTFSQFLIIWSGNLPEETSYFHNRMEGAWNILATAVILSQFFIPFLLLLSGNTKRTPKILMSVAIWIFCARILDLFWTIAPFFIKTTANDPLSVAGPYLGGLLGVGIIWMIAFEYFRKQSSPMPTFDSRLVAGEIAHHA